MSWWQRLFGEDEEQNLPYGLHPDNPILCGGGAAAEHDYLMRLRCPSGMPIRGDRLHSLKRTSTSCLERPEVRLAVSRSTQRHLGSKVDPFKLPLDAYQVACDCGDHQAMLFIDMYYRGPELPIGIQGWTLAAGVSPAEKIGETAPCPYCGESLRTPRAKQCRFCKMDWHDPNYVYRRA